MLYVNFGTGAGNYKSNLSLEELMEEVAKEVTYTQESVIIEDPYKDVVACLPWYGVKAQEDDVIMADFGDLGFYSEWIVY